MAETDQEKTEAPTSRRLQEARNDGNVAKSTDLTAACILLGAVLLLHLYGLELFTAMRGSMRSFIGAAPGINLARVDDADLWHWLAGHNLLRTIAPFAVGLMAVAVLASVSQVGFLFTTKPLEPKLNKLNPISGVKNILGMRALMRLVMSLGKIAALGGVSAYLIHRDIPQIVRIAELELLPMLAAAAELVYLLALKLAALLLILALIDYIYQRWQRAQDLKMTKQEVKEEHKRMDGDPLMKQRRMRVARQLAMQRTAQAIPTADVIVTNPTHYAIALKYDSEDMRAPKVVAKGADFMALRIRQIAVAHGVPMVERKELARALYPAVEVGDEIPPKYYSAVAEILAYVYRLGGRKTA